MGSIPAVPIECPGLPSADCGGCNQHPPPRFGIPMESPKGLAMEGFLSYKKKKQKKSVIRVLRHVYFFSMCRRDFPVNGFHFTSFFHPISNSGVSFFRD